MSSAPIRFTPDDLIGFAAASHDRSPLHVSAAYARRTPFGQPVVHGALAVLAALGRLRERPGAAAARLAVDFTAPIFAGVDYRAEVAERGPNKSSVTLRDGKRGCLRVTATYDAGALGPPLPAMSAARTTAAERPFESIEPGARQGGEYAAVPEAAQAYVERFDLARRGVGAWHVAALMAASYLVGMEMPGERALFSRLAFTFEGLAAAAGPFRYEVTVAMVDERFELIQLDVRLTAGGLVVRGELAAFVRRAAAALRPQLLDGVLPPPGALNGKRALVVGASRGLGAAIALAMARSGGDVTATYAVSAAAAEVLARAAAEASGSIQVRRADAGDVSQCQALCAEMEHDGGIDLLVCSASPAVLPLELSVETQPRFDAFVAESLRMVSTPLASALPSLAARRGRVIIVSSNFLETFPPGWPHYIAAKSAIEGLARAVAAAHPEIGCLIVRPPRLQTDMTNMAGGAIAARHPEEVAAAIVRRIHQGVGTGVTMFGGADDAALAAVTE